MNEKNQENKREWVLVRAHTIQHIHTFHAYTIIYNWILLVERMFEYRITKNDNGILFALWCITILVCNKKHVLKQLMAFARGHIPEWVKYHMTIFFHGKVMCLRMRFSDHQQQQQNVLSLRQTVSGCLCRIKRLTSSESIVAVK